MADRRRPQCHDMVEFGRNFQKHGRIHLWTKFSLQDLWLVFSQDDDFGFVVYSIPVDKFPALGWCCFLNSTTNFQEQ